MSNSEQTRMSFLTSKTVRVQGPSDADNLSENSRQTGLWYWKHAEPRWTVCGVAPSVHFGTQTTSVSIYYSESEHWLRFHLGGILKRDLGKSHTGFSLTFILWQLHYWKAFTLFGSVWPFPTFFNCEWVKWVEFNAPPDTFYVISANTTQFTHWNW